LGGKLAWRHGNRLGGNDIVEGRRNIYKGGKGKENERQRGEIGSIRGLDRKQRGRKGRIRFQRVSSHSKILATPLRVGDRARERDSSSR
jgi:hypothetical protein